MNDGQIKRLIADFNCDPFDRLIADYGSNPLNLLQHFGGYYECPRDLATGKRLGPLVGYAGKDETGKNYVGDIYANFAKAEEWPVILKHFAEMLRPQLEPWLGNIGVFCGAPMGGLTFAAALALVYERRYVYPEKKVITVASGSNREESQLEFSRHEIRRGEGVVIVEDVANNFSTTEKLVDLIHAAGGQVVAIVCLLNRSLTVSGHFELRNGQPIPVLALVRKAIKQYRQSDPEVAADIAADNVVLKPKNDWVRLQAAMYR